MKQKLNPDAFLVLQVDSAVAAKRKLPQAKSDNLREEEERVKKASLFLQKGDLTNPALHSLLKTDEKLLEDLIIK